MKGFGADRISIFFQKPFFENFTLSNGNYEKKSGEVFNSTSLPSGNLVDGLPLDLHNTDAR